MTEEEEKAAKKEKVTKTLEGTWKTLTLIGAIAAAGFAAATHLHGFQTVEQAQEDHQELTSSIEGVAVEMKDIGNEVEENDDELEAIRYINVRLTAEQRNVNDRLDILIETQRRATTWAEREEQEDRIEELEERIRMRSRAVDAARPPAAGDPLAGLEGL
ncbi:MAG: hypothetical protein MI867_13785 [Pseudomonadales bacterium]|nr:hypothetical protein [Pseudomonadales bacterium]